MRISKFVAILLTLCLITQPILGQPFGSLPNAQDRVKIGALTFVPPTGWVPTKATSPVLLAFAPPNLPAGKTCQVRVFADQVSTETFSAWFTRRWNALMSGKAKLRTSEVLTQKVGDVEIMVRSGAFQDGSGEAYALIIATSISGHFIHASYEANDFPTIEKYQNAVYEMFGTMDLPGVSDPGKTAPPKKDPETKDPTPKNPGSKPTSGKPKKPAKFQLGDPIQEGIRLDRLSEIARQLQDKTQNIVALMTEAAKLCGFAIWTEDGGKVAEPTGSPRLKLAITETEIKEYAAMYRSGHSVKLSDLIGMLDVAYKGIGSEPSCGPMVHDWLVNGGRAGNPSVRALTAFIQMLGSYRGGGSASNFDSEDLDIDPMQSILIMRVLTQDIGGALKKAIAKDKPVELFASLNHVQDDGPGAGEDAYAGIVTLLWDSITEETGKALPYAEKVGKLNAILSIIKFIATYLFLSGEMRVEYPGQPLIRTMDTDPGQDRTVVAKFWIDGTQVTDWMKDHRKLVVLAGLDIDMPKTGLLKGVPTEWKVEQSPLVAKKLIQTKRGGPDLSKVLTDEKGEAKVKWEGCPQPVKLDPNTVMPLEKQVRILVTPQVKEITVQQDLVDAVSGAIGLRAGPSGIMGPLMEMLYRMKWQGAVWLDLKIRDWQPGEAFGELNMVINQTWNDFTVNGSHTTTLDRSLVFSDIGMIVVGVPTPQKLDAQSLAKFSPLVRQQVEAGYKAQLAMSKKRDFIGLKPGTVKMAINDREWMQGPDGCKLEDLTESWSWIGTSEGEYENKNTAGFKNMFRVSVDIEKKMAYVIAASAAKVKYHREKKGGGDPSEHEDKDDALGIVSGLTLLAPYSASAPIEIPLKVSDIPNTLDKNFSGTAVIPFKFKNSDKYRGNLFLQYSIVRKARKAK